MFVADLLDEEFRAGAAPRERAFATELAAGVIRRQRTPDAVLEQHVSRPRTETEPALWTLLQLGAYQLLFLATPAHAAVFETVELTRRIARPRWERLVNGVMRSVQRDLLDDRVTA